MRHFWKIAKHCKSVTSISCRLLQTGARNCFASSKLGRLSVYGTRIIPGNQLFLSTLPTLPELTSVRYPNVKRGAFAEVLQTTKYFSKISVSQGKACVESKNAMNRGVKKIDYIGMFFYLQITDSDITYFKDILKVDGRVLTSKDDDLVGYNSDWLRTVRGLYVHLYVII